MKISQLPLASTPLTGSEEVPLVQDGVTSRVNASALGGFSPVSGSTYSALTLTANSGPAWSSTLFDNNGNISVDFFNRLLTDISENSSVDWSNRRSYDQSQHLSINWQARELSDTSGNPSAMWGQRTLMNYSVCFDWATPGKVLLGDPYSYQNGTHIIVNDNNQHIGLNGDVSLGTGNVYGGGVATSNLMGFYYNAPQTAPGIEVNSTGVNALLSTGQFVVKNNQEGWNDVFKVNNDGSVQFGLITDGAYTLPNSCSGTGEMLVITPSAGIAAWQLHTTDGSGTNSLDWGGRTLYNENATVSVDWNGGLLSDGTQTSVNWGNRILDDENGGHAILWDTNNSTLRFGGDTVLDWKNQVLYAGNSSISVNWNSRTLWDGLHGYSVLDWGNQLLTNTGGATTVDWSNMRLENNGSTTVAWGGTLLYDTGGAFSIDWSSRRLISNGTLANLDWSHTGRLLAGDPEGAMNGTVLDVDDSTHKVSVIGNFLENSTPVFTGSGTNDLSYSTAAYSNSVTSTWSVNIIGGNCYTCSVSDETGFATAGDTYTTVGGASGVVMYYIPQGYIVLSSQPGGPAPGDTDTITTNASYTATLHSPTLTPDYFNWTSSLGDSGNYTQMNGTMTLAQGLTVTFGAGTGHQAGDNWAFQVSRSQAPMLQLDFIGGSAIIGDVNEQINSTGISINDNAKQVVIYGRSNGASETGAGILADFSGAGMNVSIGDVNGVANGTAITVDDVDQEYLFGKRNFVIGGVHLTFPASQGSSNQVLTNDGSGHLSWAAPSASSVLDSTVLTGLTTTAGLLAYTPLIGTYAYQINGWLNITASDGASDTSVTLSFLDSNGNVQDATLIDVNTSNVGYYSFTYNLYSKSGGHVIHIQANQGGSSVTFDVGVSVSYGGYGSAAVAPTIDTTGFSVINNMQASVTSNITNDGGSLITARGIVYSPAPNPAISDYHSAEGGTSAGSFTWSPFITEYWGRVYVESYASNAAATGYSSNGNTFESSPCLAKGTKVTLSDGRAKNIEDVDYEDSILVWNFDEGRLDDAVPLWIKVPQVYDRYNLLKFSDGSELKTISQHRIFNKEKGMFTYPMTDDTPVGTTTFNAGGREVTLVSKEIVKEMVEFYNVITYYHINLFANGILTSCRYNNIYPIVDMRFVKDDRDMIAREKFEAEDRWYYGLRLAEQTFDVESSLKYIREREKWEAVTV